MNYCVVRIQSSFSVKLQRKKLHNSMVFAAVNKGFFFLLFLIDIIIREYGKTV